MAVLEVWRRDKQDTVALETDRFTIGRSADNDYEIADDQTVSRHHVVLERVEGVWLLRDLNAVNGTILNGRRVDGAAELHAHDEVVLGKTLLIFRDRPTTEEPATAPRLTRKEREVVKELVRPLLCKAGSRPASVTEIATRMGTGVSNIKGHLGRIYEKFGIRDEEIGRRQKRAVLAQRVLDAGMVAADDLASVGTSNE
jgi:pSer/pThr/pTyr-binding forkhead associated (FHA) protein